MNVPGFVSAARVATSRRPSLSNLSPRPCHIMSGRGVSSSSSLLKRVVDFDRVAGEGTGRIREWIRGVEEKRARTIDSFTIADVLLYDALRMICAVVSSMMDVRLFACESWT